jgi:muconolactone delta-isomerase
VEYLVTMTTHVPDGTPDQAVDDVRAREGAHSRELAEQGHLLRLWRPPLKPGEWRSLGLFAADAREAQRAHDLAPAETPRPAVGPARAWSDAGPVASRERH